MTDFTRQSMAIEYYFRKELKHLANHCFLVFIGHSLCHCAHHHYVVHVVHFQEASSGETFLASKSADSSPLVLKIENPQLVQHFSNSVFIVFLVFQQDSREFTHFPDTCATQTHAQRQKQFASGLLRKFISFRERAYSVEHWLAFESFELSRHPSSAPPFATKSPFYGNLIAPINIDHGRARVCDAAPTAQPPLPAAAFALFCGS